MARTSGAIALWAAAAAGVILAPVPAARVVIVGAAGFMAARWLIRGSVAMAVGLVWLALSIGAEIAVATIAGHPWHALLGAPDHPAARLLMIAAWILAPAAFARRA